MEKMYGDKQRTLDEFREEGGKLRKLTLRGMKSQRRRAAGPFQFRGKGGSWEKRGGYEGRYELLYARFHRLKAQPSRKSAL